MASATVTPCVALPVGFPLTEALFCACETLVQNRDKNTARMEDKASDIRRLVLMGISSSLTVAPQSRNRPRAAELVDRAEAAAALVSATQVVPIQTICQQLVRFAKAIHKRIYIRKRGTEVGMIQDIEHLCPELQLQGLFPMYMEISVHGKVPLPGTKSSQSISGKITLARGGAREIHCRITSGR